MKGGAKLKSKPISRSSVRAASQCSTASRDQCVPGGGTSSGAASPLLHRFVLQRQLEAEYWRSWLAYAAGLLFGNVGLIWLTSFAVAVARSRSALSTPRVRRIQERLTATVLIALGIRIVLERR